VKSVVGLREIVKENWKDGLLGAKSIGHRAEGKISNCEFKSKELEARSQEKGWNGGLGLLNPC